jgi:hypothetical protein
MFRADGTTDLIQRLPGTALFCLTEDDLECILSSLSEGHGSQLALLDLEDYGQSSIQVSFGSTAMNLISIVAQVDRPQSFGLLDDQSDKENDR